MEGGLIKRQTALPEHIVQFCSFLRNKKFNCSITEEAEVLRVMTSYVPGSQSDFQALLRALLVKNKQQFLRFDELFVSYWSQLSRAEDSKVKEQTTRSQQPQTQRQPPSLQELKNWLFNGRVEETEEIATYAATEVFTRKDFSAFDAYELDALQKVIRQFARLLARRQKRRFQSARKPAALDLRRSIQKNLARGGEIDYLLWKKPKPGKQRVLLFCDVSKSMDLYARFLIQFMYGFHRVSIQLEAFVFSTSLTHVSPALRHQDFGESLQKLSGIVPDWSGGTNIGQALRAYQLDYGRRYLDRETTVIVMSDGWDQGEPAPLVQAMQFLRKHSRQLIWINPLAGHPGFEAKTIGMQAALPFIDHFTSAHNLASLVELVRYLGHSTLRK